MYLQLMTHEANEIFIKKTAESDQIYRIVKLSMFTMKQTFHSIKFYRKNRICELKVLNLQEKRHQNFKQKSLGIWSDL